MKKFLAILCAAVLAAAVLAFAGCEKVYIKGDFSEEASAEEVSALYQKAVSAEGAVQLRGAAETEEYSLRLLGKSDTRTAFTLAGESVEATAAADIDMTVSRVKAGEKYAARCRGNVDISAEGAGIGTFVKGDMYIDGTTFYLDGSMKSSGIEGDLSWEGKLVIPAGGSFTGAAAGGVDLGLGSAESMQGAVLEFWHLALGDGGKVYIDDGGSEVKIKVSFDVQYFLGLLADEYGPVFEGLDIAASVQVDTLDYYLSYEKDTMVFTGFGAVCEASVHYEAEGVSVEIEQKASSWLLAGGKTAEAPAGLEDYEEVSVA